MGPSSLDPGVIEAYGNRPNWLCYVAGSGRGKLHAELTSAFDLFVAIDYMTDWWVPLVRQH